MEARFFGLTLQTLVPLPEDDAEDLHRSFSSLGGADEWGLVRLGGNRIPHLATRGDFLMAADTAGRGAAGLAAQHNSALDRWFDAMGFCDL